MAVLYVMKGGKSNVPLPKNIDCLRINTYNLHPAHKKDDENE